MTILGYAVCNDGAYFDGYTTATAEEAIHEHIPDGGAYPVKTDDPARDPHGWPLQGMIEVWAIHSDALMAILREETITTLTCEDEGDFVEGADFVKEGNYRWARPEEYLSEEDAHYEA